jgi:uncharacterized damage-inducible protein DinB
VLTKTFKGSKKDLIEIWKEISLGIKKFIEDMPDDLLLQKLSFKNTKGIEHSLSYYQLLAHIVNHSAYHRGQVVTMLRQVGYTDITSVDIVTYFRIKNDMPVEMVNN